MDKEVFGYISLAFTVAACAPYIWSTLRGKTRPHVFTWTIWSVVMAIAAAGQYAGDAGPGWWATCLGAICTMFTAIVSLKYGDKYITRHDIVFFVAALAAIPLWYVTSNPLSAIVLVTFIDVLGYFPTFRKAWHRPQEEMPLHFIISNMKHAASIVAMYQYTFTTTLYPVAMFIMNGALVAMIVWRRTRP